MTPAALPSTDRGIGRTAAAAMRAAIRLAGGREVCFVCTIGEDGDLATARVVARGDAVSVLALPGCAQRGEMLVHNHPSGDLSPSDADHSVASRLHDDGIGFGIINNSADELYVVVEVPGEKTQTDVDPTAIAHDLGPDGLIARKLARYEDRGSQREMAVKIARLYNDGGIGLLEAGTGVGKSLAYLVPALRWAKENKDRTIVSTNTINLQEQLVGKDLPFLAEALDDQPVRFAMLKGWRNYLCLIRLDQATSSGASLFEDSSTNELAAIAAWAERTKDGSLADLPSPPSSAVWDEVSAEPDLCARAKCTRFDDCFLYKARREAARADVIVVNHHLLLSDLAVRRAQQNWQESAVLPAYSRLVIDEGHHLEDAAATHLGLSVTRTGLLRQFRRLDRRGRGLLATLAMKLETRKKEDLLSTASLDLVQERLIPSADAARDKASLVFDLLGVMMDERRETIMRLTPEFASHPVWANGLRAGLGDLLSEIEMLSENIRLVRGRHEGESRNDEELAPVFNELRAVANRLQMSADGLRSALEPSTGGPPLVRWIEIRGRDRNVAVAASPLDLAPVLREDLFSRVKTAVVTSATLSTGGRFDFLVNRLGLDDPELEPVTASFPSPFDFARQSLLAIPTDMPAPNLDQDGHSAALVRIILDHAEAADGGLFVLFTSHREVRRTANELRARGAERRWPLLVHGDDARDALLRRFRDAGRALLLGTASFWEGVDVPGDALRGLILARLPFRVPTEPMTAAQCEAITERGGDPFTEFMLPHAGLRLKQGFGRLIRTSTDRGAVLLCDPRAATKTYGRNLVAGLPPARRLIGPWQQLHEEVRAFYPRNQSLAS